MNSRAFIFEETTFMFHATSLKRNYVSLKHRIRR